MIRPWKSYKFCLNHLAKLDQAFHFSIQELDNFMKS
jgi:hypothetical protein